MIHFLSLLLVCVHGLIIGYMTYFHRILTVYGY